MTILELLRSQLNDTVAERLGAAVNLGPDQAREVLAQALPLQVGALSQWAAAPGGAATLLDLARTHVPQGDAQEILSRPGGIQQLQVAGRRLLPELVGSTAAAQVAARTGALPSAVQGMMGLLLPLVLGVVSRQAGAGAGGSGGLSGLLGAASLGGAAGVAALGSAGLDNSDQGASELHSSHLGTSDLPSSGLGASELGVSAAEADLGSGPEASEERAHAAGPLTGDGIGSVGAAGGMLGGVAGDSVSPDAATADRPPVSSAGLAGSDSGAVDASGPADWRGSLESAAPTELRSRAAGLGAGAAAGLGAAALGAAGLEAARAGATGLGTAGLDAAGLGTAAAGLGETGLAAAQNHTENLGAGLGVPTELTAPSTADLNLAGLNPAGLAAGVGAAGAVVAGTVVAGVGATVIKAAGSAAELGSAGLGAVTGRQDDGRTSSPGTLATGTPATPERRGGPWLWLLPLLLLLGLGGCYLLTQNGGAPVSITAPASGASVPGEAFNMTGAGRAGDTLSVSEAGKELTTTTVAADGKWTAQIPAPSQGAHTYDVTGRSTKATLAVTAAKALCKKDFSVSLKDGAVVTAPYTFGGVGSGKSYSVVVTRGERKIGTKVIPLDDNCAWQYTSDPGKGAVNYQVFQDGAAAADASLNITVK